jgi:chromosome segregation ATPase
MDINDSSARIRDLEHTVGEKEREIEMLKDSIREMTAANPVSDERVKALELQISEMNSANPVSDERVKALEVQISEMNSANPANDERVKALERQVNEMSGMVRGLTAEMLDLKAWIQKLSKSLDGKGAENRRAAADKKREAAVVKGPKRYPDPEKPVDVAVKKTEESRRREEKERSEEVLIIQPDGTMKPERMKGDGMIIADNRGGHIPSRRASERDPRDRKPLIYADDDDDSVEITRKRK